VAAARLFLGEAIAAVIEQRNDWQLCHGVSFLGEKRVNLPIVPQAQDCAP
jgi:hypothetical protein